MATPRSRWPPPRAAQARATRASGARLALMVRGKAVEVANDLEIFEEIEPLDGAQILQEAELLSHDDFVRADRLRGSGHLATAPDRDEQEDPGEARRQRDRHGTPPPAHVSAPRLELLAKLCAIARPVHRRRLPDRVREIAEKIPEQLGVLLAVRTLLEMSSDALALGRGELPPQIGHEIGIGMPCHVSASPPSSSVSRGPGAGGRARSPRSI